MDIHCVHYSGEQSPSFLFVPGFFTQPLVPGSPFDTSWERQILKVARTHNVNGYIVRWPAGNIRDISLVRGFGAARSAIESAVSSWCGARGRTYSVIDALSEHIVHSDRPVHIAGHSLGGRIALKVSENLSSFGKIRSITALAPAISASDIDLNKVAAAAAKTPLICYSSRDRVLSTLFPCGEQSSDVLSLCRSGICDPANMLRQLSSLLEGRSANPALGLVGVPPEYKHMFSAVDTRLSHTTYARNLPNIMRDSRNLNP